MTKCLVCKAELNRLKFPKYISLPNDKIRYLCAECYYEFDELNSIWEGEYRFWDLIQITRENIESERSDEDYFNFFESSRICFKCSKTIHYIDFFETNQYFGKERINKWWKSKAIQFFCCDCYREIKKNPETLEFSSKSSNKITFQTGE